MENKKNCVCKDCKDCCKDGKCSLKNECCVDKCSCPNCKTNGCCNKCSKDCKCKDCKTCCKMEQSFPMLSSVDNGCGAEALAET